MRMFIIIFFVLMLNGIPCFSASEEISHTRPELLPAPGTATFITQGIPGKNIMGYWLFLPEKYNTSPAWPILIFLHGGGAGENPDINRVKRFGPLKYVVGDSLSNHKLTNLLKGFVIICPILPENPKNFTLWIDNIKALDTIIDSIINDHRGDSSRLYISGSSRGGSGAWRFPKYSKHPIAAIVPVCGHYLKRVNLKSLVHIPVWITCNTGDRLYNIQRRAVSFIEEQGGEKFLVLKTTSPDNPSYLKQKHLATFFNKKGHNAWTATYSSPQVYQWMLSFQNIKGKIIQKD